MICGSCYCKLLSNTCLSSSHLNLLKFSPMWCHPWCECKDSPDLLIFYHHCANNGYISCPSRTTLEADRNGPWVWVLRYLAQLKLLRDCFGKYSFQLIDFHGKNWEIVRYSHSSAKGILILWLVDKDFWIIREVEWKVFFCDKHTSTNCSPLAIWIKSSKKPRSMNKTGKSRAENLFFI